MLHAPDGHGHIVDHAEAFAVVGERVVEAAADADGNGVHESLAGSENGPSSGQPESLHQFGRVGYLELLLLASGEGASFQLVNVVKFVNEKNVLVLGGFGREEVLGTGELGFQQAFADAAVLFGWEDVLADGEVVAVAIDEFEREHVRSGYSFEG